MKLLLTSAGLSNKSIVDALLNMAGRNFAELNLAFIPTAANVEDGGKSWLIDDLANCKKLGFKQIDIVDISAIAKDLWLPRLEASDVLLFGGGNTFHLMSWIEKSGLKNVLPKMLEKKIYVGISAGSIVTSKRVSLLNVFYENEFKNENQSGLGFVDFQIRPHLNSPYFPKANLKNLQKIAEKFSETFYAIDDSTAIKVVDGQIEIVSEGVWRKFN